MVWSSVHCLSRLIIFVKIKSSVPNSNYGRNASYVPVLEHNREVHRIFLGPKSSFWSQNRFLGTDESNFWDQNRFLAPAMILSSGYDLRPDIQLLSRSKALFMYHFKTHLRYFEGHQKLLCFESSFSAEVIWSSIYMKQRGTNRFASSSRFLSCQTAYSRAKIKNQGFSSKIH